MYYSLVQNQIVVTVKEKSIMTLSDAANAIIPIEWEIFDDEKVNLGKLITVYLEENPESEEAFALDPAQFALANSKPSSAASDQERIALPWDESDTVSKAYYVSVLNSGILARL
jgi:hypothetical protein